MDYRKQSSDKYKNQETKNEKPGDKASGGAASESVSPGASKSLASRPSQTGTQTETQPKTGKKNSSKAQSEMRSEVRSEARSQTRRKKEPAGKNTSHAKRKRRRKRIWKAILLVFLLCLIAVSLAGGYYLKRIIGKAPDITALSLRPEGFATMLYDSAGNEVEKLVMEGTNREEAAYEEFPEHLVDAFIAIEDERFWKNSGVDIRAIMRAVKGVLTGNSSAGGGSTITQQLIKNAVFQGGMESTFEERLERKIQEQYLAVKLNKMVDKKTIMTNYLNTINLGSNTLGVKVAARRYFDKDVSELTLSECAVLAGITKNPSRLNPLTGAEENEKRRKIILSKMEEQGLISQEEKEEALADDVYARIQNVDVTARASATPYSYFTDEVIDQVTEALMDRLGYSEAIARKMLYGGGLSIYTTQDPSIQAIVDEEINNPENYKTAFLSADYRLSVRHADGSVDNYSDQDIKTYHKDELKDNYTGLYNTAEELQADVDRFKAAVVTEGDEITGERLQAVLQPQVSFVLMDQRTGEVKAINGGRGEKTASRTLNRASDTLRQPGSTFKVISSFAPALDSMGATLGTTYYDAPYSVGKKSFRNWYSRFLGYSNIREGIVYSMNIVAVRCMMETISPELGVKYAEKFGITSMSEKDYNASTALGGITAGVSNLELTGAYAAIAAGGVYTKPVFFTKIVDHDGKVLIENEPERHEALKPQTAFLLTDALREAMSGGPKFATSPVNPTGGRARLSKMTCAGKSGTTTASKDLWFTGFTPWYTAGIWSGNDGSQAVSGGTSYHKDIWKKIMDRVHEGLQDPGFTVPDGIVKVQICRKSGKLAIPGVCTNDPRGNAVYTEYFAEGTQPTVLCDRHVISEVCTESGQSATEFCPEIATGVFLIVPLGEGTTDDTQYTLPPRCTLHGDMSSIVLPPGTGEDDGQKESGGAAESTAGRESRPSWDLWPTQPARPTQESKPSWDVWPTQPTRPTQESKPPWDVWPTQATRPTQQSTSSWESKPTQESTPPWQKPTQKPTQESTPSWQKPTQKPTQESVPSWQRPTQESTQSGNNPWNGGGNGSGGWNNWWSRN